MGKYHEISFPGENKQYRKMRNELLDAEISLRKQIEAVASLWRKLPWGGKLKEDYVFEEGAADLADGDTVHQVKFSELFYEGKDSLIIYSFMYPPDNDTPCPMCTSLLDGLNGAALHVKERVNFAVVAKSDIKKIRDWAQKRGWQNLHLLSSRANTYNRDYHAEFSDDSQLPAVNVFHRAGGEIYHFYNTELLYLKSEKGQHPRHVDLIWPIWNIFDLTPEGRGSDWYPKVPTRNQATR